MLHCLLSIPLLLFLLTPLSCNKKEELELKSSEEPAQTTLKAEQTGDIPILGGPEEEELLPPSLPPEALPMSGPSTPQTPVTSLPGTTDTTTPLQEVPSLAAPNIPLPAKIPEVSKPAPLPFVPKLMTSKSDIVILLDASGSMNAPFGKSSVFKFSLLRETLIDVLDEVALQKDFPRNVSLRVFGSEAPAEAKKCDDTKSLYSMGEADPNGIRQVLEPLKAQGTSPLALALEQAAKDFPAESGADRLIVAIVDGGDTCDADPCLVAEKIQQTTGKTMIHVIGFDIEPQEQEKLSCIASKGDGRFFLARTEEELRTAFDEAINSTVPYNLKIMTMVGATPLPTTLSILQPGAEKVFRKENSFGTKLLRLDPGTYDILIEYPQSPESRKPSKILKGVEVLASTKVEQTVTFDLGSLTLSAIDDSGQLIGALYRITRKGEGVSLPEMKTDAKPASLFLSPGTYDITAERADESPDQFTLTHEEIILGVGEAKEERFKFQHGEVILKGITSQKKSIPFLFQVSVSGKPESLVASGAFNAEGGSITLSPGSYDFFLQAQDPEMPAYPGTRLTNIIVKAAETTEAMATFELGIMRLTATDNQKKPLRAHFVLHEDNKQEILTEVDYEGTKIVELSIPPGTYDLEAFLSQAQTEPKPMLLLNDMKVTIEKPIDVNALFALGTLRLRGRDSKEHLFETKFTLYREGTDEVVMSAPPAKNWNTFETLPGVYDIRAEKIETLKPEEEPRTVWLQDVRVEESKTVSHEAIFTQGKIKIIGRGPNSKIITCHFKIFQYGSDRELINGSTANDWQTFEIEPGKYYMEAAYHDTDSSQMLKKWINIEVGENQIVEQVIRF